MTDEEDKRPPSILSAIRRAQAEQRGTGAAGQPSESKDRAREAVEPSGDSTDPPLPPSPPSADDAADDVDQPESFDADPAQLEAVADVSDTRRRFEQWARNPECRANAISAVHGIPMADVAVHEGIQPTSGQSAFLLARTVTFERDLLANGAKRLREALADKDVLPAEAQGLKDLRTRLRGGPEADVKSAVAATEALLRRIADGGSGIPAVIVGAAVCLRGDAGNADVALIVDVVAVRDTGDARELVVGVIKTFPDRGGHTESRELVTARAQAGLFVHALQQLVADLGLSPRILVRTDGFIVMTRPGSIFPAVRAGEELEFQAERARRGLDLLRTASQGAASFDPAQDHPVEALAQVDTTYRESCVGFCERAEKCHASAQDRADPVVLGDDVKRFLGAIDLRRALDLLDGAEPQDATEEDLVRRMREGEDRSGGTKGSDIVRRLRAFKAGAPLKYGETRRIAIAANDDLLILAFVRMGGESRPWGIAYGHPGAEPTVLSVPEGRDRDLVAKMCAELAPVLLRHLRTPGYSSDAAVPSTDLSPLRQIWLPNASHLDMLHHMAYAYVSWNKDQQELLTALGRACGWLFREAQRPGQQHVVVATRALTESFTFPAQNVRQQHLGYLLAWLDPEGDRDARTQAATDAERLSVSTSLDPVLERDKTERLVARWGRVRQLGEEDLTASTAAKLHRVLEAELTRRFALTEEAIDQLRQDGRRPNSGIATLVQEALKEQWNEYTGIELRLADPDATRPFVASPETDLLPAAAGRRYLVHDLSERRWKSVLLHDDADLLQEAIASGDAFRGTITAVAVEADGGGRRPVWTIGSRDHGHLRLREDSWVCVAGRPELTGILRALRDLPEGGREFRVAITSWGAARQVATSDANVSTQVVMVSDSSLGIVERKIALMGSSPGPGEWLTHSTPGGPRSQLAEEAAENPGSHLLGDHDG